MYIYSCILDFINHSNYCFWGGVGGLQRGEELGRRDPGLRLLRLRAATYIAICVSVLMYDVIVLFKSNQDNKQIIVLLSCACVSSSSIV